MVGVLAKIDAKLKFSGMIKANSAGGSRLLPGNQSVRRQRSNVVGLRPVPKAAVTALAPLEILNRLQHVDAAKVRPEPVSDEDLRVGDLPQQEVRDAHLTRRADQQIRVRHVRRVQMP